MGRKDFRVVHLSPERDHIHLIVEAETNETLSAGMQAFQISAAQHLNRAISKRYGRKRRGTVFADRYHTHLLRTPSEARHARAYVLSNWQVHARREGLPLPRGTDPFSSAGCEPGATCSPRFWMLCVGIWRGPPLARQSR